jgi:hypothetical protein
MANRFSAPPMQRASSATMPVRPRMPGRDSTQSFSGAPHHIEQIRATGQPTRPAFVGRHSAPVHGLPLASGHGSRPSLPPRYSTPLHYPASVPDYEDEVLLKRPTLKALATFFGAFYCFALAAAT